MPGPRREYLLGYPRAAVRVVAGELVARTILAALFVVVPACVAWSVLTGPWHMASPWSLVGLPLGLVLATIAAFTARALLSDARERFGLRVVPQFARTLDPDPATYFSGRRIAAHMQRLDALAAELDVAPLSHYGFARPDDAPGPWHDAASGRATVAALLARVEPATALHAELSTWLTALRRAEAAGVGFRLVLVAGTAMNDPLWRALRAAGY